MIKFVLVIYAVTATGPAVQPVAEFVSPVVCESAGRAIQEKLRTQLKTPKVTYVCHEVAEV